MKLNSEKDECMHEKMCQPMNQWYIVHSSLFQGSINEVMNPNQWIKSYVLGCVVDERISRWINQLIDGLVGGWMDG
jgi:hypothetical protein